ncbi:MAG: carbamoyltransferase HypF [candidate division KSB1 bacterium]|nr:carbamoyltransferase HypF [candidate division KSB1 bacterium]
MPIIRQKIRINGIVQGVGFRPFVYRLAQECGIAGFVNNSSDGVLIEAEGPPEALATFRERLRREAPPLSHIVEFEYDDLPPRGDTQFVIQQSRRDSAPVTLISPDVATCDDCLRELFDPGDRRYRYPFINCTNCGPRYTIVYTIPYDRGNTSMRVFPMCPECEREYHDPANRRFHAQPNACPKCGPQVTLYDRRGQPIDADDPIARAVDLLRAGHILAIRGLGGFHLAVDAHNDAAVRELRRRKGRAEKPFALMAPDLDSIEKFCIVSEAERELLQHPTRPIVLLPARDGHRIAPSVAPNQRYLGFILPYTPLHHLLLRGHFDALVMTSGNFTEEPIAIGNGEALERLAHLADYFLLHNRDILQRCDDSIARMAAGKPRIIRRSRGYVPAPVFLKTPTRRNILACGGELKNTIALSRGNTVFFSQHIGDLDNPAALAFFENSIAHLQRILEIEPEIIAYDLHPEYLSTKWALAQDLPKIGVQHHHAHLAAVMAENGVEVRTIGIILDGTGYGTDGTIWGGEVLVGDFSGFERFAHLEPVPLPGGEAAIRQPWRMAVSYLYAAYGEALWDLPLLQRIHEEKVRIILQMIDKRLNAPLTSSCGRLFDGVAALLGIRDEINYEAQAAIELEMHIDETVDEFYAEALPARTAKGALDWRPLIRVIVEELQRGEPVGRIAVRFHRTFAELFIRAAEHAREETGLQRVGLSGGVYQNTYFFEYMVQRLQEHDFEVLTHSLVPTNDGGLALGQIAIANATIEHG